MQGKTPQNRHLNAGETPISDRHIALLKSRVAQTGSSSWEIVRSARE
jgi:hypothetical protein